MTLTHDPEVSVKPSGPAAAIPMDPTGYIFYILYTLYSVEEYGFEKPVMPCLSAAGGAPAYFGRPVVALDQPNPIQPDLHTCLSIITKVNIVKKTNTSA